MAPFLDERGRRLCTGGGAGAAGRGGGTPVRTATRAARSTIGRGLAELRGGRDDLGSRIRRPGGGRKPAVETQPGLLEALGELVQSAIRGDPEAALLWVSKSQRHLARALTERGFAAGQKLVGRLLRRLGFSLQANRKTREGTSHPDRDAQFDYINARVKAWQTAGQPAISVDTKKTELVGDFKNGGRELRPKGQPEAVRVHDFARPDLGKVVPYGVYDIAAKAGWINLGIDHDTAAFAVESIRHWWRDLGRPPLPHRHPVADHRRLRRPQRRAGPAVEARVAGLRRRDRAVGHGGPPAAGHQPVEPDRASAVRLHHPDLARQAPADPPGDRPIDRPHHHPHRPHRPVPPRPQRLREARPRCPMPRWPPSIFSPPRFTATGTTRSCHDSPQTDAVVRAQALTAHFLTPTMRMQ